MKNSRFIYNAVAVLLVGILFVAYGCQKDDQGNRVTYYKTIGEGYIYDGTNNKPLKGAKITVTSVYNGIEGPFYTPKTINTFTTDENGYYQFRFIKRVGIYKVVTYWFKITDLGSMMSPWIGCSPSEVFPEKMCVEDIKDKKTITFDTAKYCEDK